MPNSDILKSAISATKTPELGATDTTEPTMESDGTATIPVGVLPEGTAEGDIIQMEVILSDENGVVVRPVESRIKQPGVGNADVKAAGTDNSSIGAMPKM